MKIPSSIRSCYESQIHTYLRLQDLVEIILKPNLNSRWHFEGRVKTVLSYALKLESGRVTDPYAVEDFYACTVVVPRHADIEMARGLINERFNIYEQRPPETSITTKFPDTFRFDHLRLYVFIPDSETNRPTGLEGIVFEIQIKTFLQHAWAVATHDFSYKTDQISWARDRLASQLMAILEHSEIAIDCSEQIVSSSILSKEFPRTKRLQKIIQLLERFWDSDHLPPNRKRLAENIDTLLQKVGVDVNTLQTHLTKEKADGRGSLMRSLSPYSSIVKTLVVREETKVLKRVQNQDKRAKWKLLLPSDITDIPTEILNAPLVTRVRPDIRRNPGRPK